VASRPELKKCFGWNGKTNQKVGERHRWSGDVSGSGWGKGYCIWCNRDLDQLRVKPNHEMSLEEAITCGEAEAGESPWRPSYWRGEHGITKGWYIKRSGAGTEWMKGTSGELVRFDSEVEARKVIDAAR
jgi:hypothetical protein